MWLYLSPLFLDDAALQFELCVVSTSFEEGLRQATCDNPLQEMEKKSLELELIYIYLFFPIHLRNPQTRSNPSPLVLLQFFHFFFFNFFPRSHFFFMFPMVSS